MSGNRATRRCMLTEKTDQGLLECSIALCTLPDSDIMELMREKEDLFGGSARGGFIATISGDGMGGNVNGGH
jgi:hypothetical protein